jgi:protein SCO1/2
MAGVLRSLRVVALAFGLAAAACAPREPEQRYELRGTIVDVDRDDQRVTIQHEAIPGYMDAMTMPFRVKDARLMVAMAPGRVVSADLVVAGNASWIENVVVTTNPGAPSTPSRVEGATEPTPGARAPDFSLVDENGRAVSLATYRGKAVALTFIYTRCPLPDYCPLMTNNFGEVERALAGDEKLAASVALLSISIDPEYDTPAVMRRYARDFAAGPNGDVPKNWSFLTGDAARVRSAAEAYGLIYETEAGQIVHTLRTAVVAPDGTLLKVYRGNDWKAEDLARDLAEAARQP